MKYTTATQLAKMMGITRSAVHYRIGRGLIRAEQVGGSLWVVSPDEIERMRKSGELRKLTPQWRRGEG